MTRLRMVLRGFVHHRRMHAAVAAGVAIATAVLTGALLVGASVRQTLSDQARARIGQVQHALVAGDRFFDDDLGDRLGDAGEGDYAAAILVPAVAVRPDGKARVHGAMAVGVDERFWTLAPQPTELRLGAGDVAINREAQRRLGVQVGDDVVLRVDRVGGLSRDAALSGEAASVVLRARVAHVVEDAAFGGFSLVASPQSAVNVFVRRELLAAALDKPGKANVLLTSHALKQGVLRQAAIRSVVRLSDYELVLRTTPQGRAELVSDRVFLDAPVAAAVEAAGEPGTGVLTYFVNSLRHADRATPYSMVSAIGPSHPLVAGLRDDQIVINDWLARDLEAVEGDAITLRYWVMDTGNRLSERSSAFTVAKVVPMTGLAGDATLMPEFPGLHDAEDCRDWEPGVPVAVERIRPEDETYWDTHRGTPKAFVTLAAGQRMWSNRFGSLTAVRFDAAVYHSALATTLLTALDPEGMGLTFANVRDQAMAAAGQGTDFASLFLGLSSFLLMSALLLAGLLQGFGLDSRASEAGVLLATGWRVREVRRLFGAEALVALLPAVAVGVGLGVGYTAGVLRLLNSTWRGAVGGAAIELAMPWPTIAAGAAASLAAAGAALLWTVRRWGRVPTVSLLAGEAWASGPARQHRSLVVWCMAGVAMAAAVVLAVVAKRGGLGTGGQAAANAWFAAGGCVLLAGLAVLSAALRRGGRSAAALTRAGLAWRGATRRRGRSLAVGALLAAGLFLVLAVGATQLQLPRDPSQRGAGTGGFAWYGEVALPLLHDLNTPRGREAMGLSESDMAGVSVVPLRVSRGDDASCLSLTRAQQPRVIGVEPRALAERGAFTFVAGDPRGWLALEDEADNVVPAIADRNTLMWGLRAGVGDVIHTTDERGRALDLRIVGVLDNSILQGGVIVAESVFVRRFPSVAGWQAMLVDAPPADADTVGAILSDAMADLGATLTPTARRLATFHAVENTYRGIFQAIGALGLLLGGAAVGAVVLRNVLERRAELAVLRATGFTATGVRRLVTWEHALLAGAGLVIGTTAAAVAAGGDLLGPVAAAIAVFVTAAVMAWVALAAWLALRGPLLDALRSE